MIHSRDGRYAEKKTKESWNSITCGDFWSTYSIRYWSINYMLGSSFQSCERWRRKETPNWEEWMAKGGTIHWRRIFPFKTEIIQALIVQEEESLSILTWVKLMTRPRSIALCRKSVASSCIPEQGATGETIPPRAESTWRFIRAEVTN